MFDRVELKNNAKVILRKNYWWVVLVTFIFSITIGKSSFINEGNSINSTYTENGIITNGNYFNGINNFGLDDVGNIFEKINATYMNMYNEIIHIMQDYSIEELMLLMNIFIFSTLISLIVSVFVMAPIRVGCRRWYLLNRTTKPNIEVVAFGFKNGYLNIVKTKFLMKLFISLWTLLFIVPGIVKSYEYRMIPYLLAENPNMNLREAFARSKKMMEGYKWEAFVLDLSFWGWLFLSVFTAGILNIFYVSPYIELTNTELYVKLCQINNK